MILHGRHRCLVHNHGLEITVQRKIIEQESNSKGFDLESPKAPKAHVQFVERFPRLGQAWELIALAGKDGPIDERTARLLKLAVALGAMREGAVHSSVRKALAMGITIDEIEQVVALSAGALSLPSVVAVYTWVQDEIQKTKPAQ